MEEWCARLATAWLPSLWPLLWAESYVLEGVIGGALRVEGRDWMTALRGLARPTTVEAAGWGGDDGVLLLLGGLRAGAAAAEEDEDEERWVCLFRGLGASLAGDSCGESKAEISIFVQRQER